MRQNEPEKPRSLTPRQVLALPYIAAAHTVVEGAKAATIGRATLHRWMEDPVFRAQLKRLRDEAAALAHVELQGLMLKSLLVLAGALDDINPAKRVRAARTALSVAMRSDEARETRKRI
jgi:hypothetical protein